MKPLSQKTKAEINLNPFYKVCARNLYLNDHECKGRITMEHALIYAGKQVDDPFAIVPLCAYSHGVDEFQGNNILDKEINHWIALNRATENDFVKYYKSDWRQRKVYLNSKFGELPTVDNLLD